MLNAAPASDLRVERRASAIRFRAGCRLVPGTTAARQILLLAHLAIHPAVRDASTALALTAVLFALVAKAALVAANLLARPFRLIAVRVRAALVPVLLATLAGIALLVALARVALCPVPLTLIALRLIPLISLIPLTLVLALGVTALVLLLIHLRTSIGDRGKRDAACSRFPAMIAFEQVSAWRGPRLVLHEVTFTVARGETVALVGRSGAGKSTILKLINRMLE